MKLLNKSITYIKKNVEFLIELDNNTSILIYKWALDSEYGDCDSGWDFVDDTEKEKLDKWANGDDDKIDAFDDFINDLSVYNN